MTSKRVELLHSVDRYLSRHPNPAGDAFDEAMIYIRTLGSDVQNFDEEDWNEALAQFGLDESEISMLQETIVEYI